MFPGELHLHAVENKLDGSVVPGLRLGRHLEHLQQQRGMADASAAVLMWHQGELGDAPPLRRGAWCMMHQAYGLHTGGAAGLWKLVQAFQCSSMWSRNYRFPGMDTWRGDLAGQ